MKVCYAGEPILCLHLEDHPEAGRQPVVDKYVIVLASMESKFTPSPIQCSPHVCCTVVTHNRSQCSWAADGVEQPVIRRHCHYASPLVEIVWC